MKYLGLFVIVILLTSCEARTINEPFKLPVSSDSIKYVQITYRDSTRFIKNRDSLNKIIENITNSKISVVKWGSNHYLKFYDSLNNRLFALLFRDNMFKSNGVVYKSKKYILDCK